MAGVPYNPNVPWRAPGTDNRPDGIGRQDPNVRVLSDGRIARRVLPSRGYGGRVQGRGGASESGNWWDDLFGGGSGGGGGGYNMSAAIKAQYDRARGDAKGRYDGADAKLGDIYGKLKASYEGLPAGTAVRFDQAIRANNEGTDRLISEARARIAQEAAKRAAVYEELGVGAPPTATAGDASAAAGEAERAIGDLSTTGANWAGFMGAGRESQITRDNLNITGAADAGTLARDNLLDAYQAYLDNLGLQEQQAMLSARGSGGGGGGGGGGGMMSDIQKAIIGKKLAEEEGVYLNSWMADAYGPQAGGGGGNAFFDKLAGYGMQPEQFYQGMFDWAGNSMNQGNYWAQQLNNGTMSPEAAYWFSQNMKM